MPENKSTIDFVGIGGQRCGTSWIYACLYEHPEICAPRKEIHFFSRDRYEKGIDWYLSQFSKCEEDKLWGEYSTSYLHDHDPTAERIHKHFPDTKIIVSLRNPVDRAFSQYRNAIKSNQIDKHASFQAFLDQREGALKRGLYTDKLKTYMDLFGPDQMHVLIYEDSLDDPQGFIQSIYAFLDIDDSFMPNSLEKTVNKSRTPKAVWLERITVRISQFLRKTGLDKLVWWIKKSGLPDLMRAANTENDKREMGEKTREELREHFADDVATLSELIDQDLKGRWYNHEKY